MSDETEAPGIPTDRLVAAYIKMRDARSQLKQEYEEKDKAIKQQMEVVETHLLETCKKAGADSISTKFGTVMRGVKTQYWTSDWDSMTKFILENEAVHLLERRVGQTAMKEFLQANPDKFPPGLNVNSEYTITIRRK